MRWVYLNSGLGSFLQYIGDSLLVQMWNCQLFISDIKSVKLTKLKKRQSITNPLPLLF